MANILKTSTDKVKANLLGAAAGGVLVWWASKKYAGVSNTWLRVGLTVVGAIAGANVQGSIKAKSSAPKGSDIKK
jgi:hypothetical protein